MPIIVNNDQQLDPQWQEWFEVMRKLASLMSKGDFSSALDEIETVLAGDATLEVRSDALGFRAHIKEQTGDLEAAMEDLLAARSLVGPGYARYVHELSLGHLCLKKSKGTDDSLFWYRSALQTSIEGEHVSCGSALNGLLALQFQAELSAEDFELCRRAAEHSWQILGLIGQPDFSDFPRVMSMIRNVESKPLS